MIKMMKKNNKNHQKMKINKNNFLYSLYFFKYILLYNDY